MSATGIPNGVRSLLWLRAGGRCQFKGCNEPLWQDGLTKLRMNASQIAHIVADSPQGPRGHAVDSTRLAKDVSNLMLLCPTHHKLVDSKEHEARYTREALEKMKEVHEHRIELMTSLHGDNRTQMVTYWVNVGEKRHFMSDQLLVEAVLPGGYPVAVRPMELGAANNRITDTDEVFWRSERLQLSRQFDQLLKPNLGVQPGHFSVFAVAPQPLLIYLGSLLSDLVPAEVYQLHREPQNWAWRLYEESKHPMPYLSRSGDPQGHPCLVVAISAEVARARIEEALGPSLDLWTISLPGPHNDVMQSREQLAVFRKIAREALEGLSQLHPDATDIHVFPVAPVSACIELGRVIQPRACLPLMLYNQTSVSAGFSQAFRINEPVNRSETQ